ncbi:MAG: hypothetical protein SGI77_11150 [Pirellulaceae bacterium]|nr:hypothetical protein [Pirellulaceae bacterium]
MNGAIVHQIGAGSKFETDTVSKLRPSLATDFADPIKLEAHGPFDWNKYTPIIVEDIGGGLFRVQEGMTRWENALRAELLPAYVFPKVEVKMSDLDDGYKMLLNVGFIVLRDAIQSGTAEWIKAEMKMLHNIPSLIGEPNAERHKYYWHHERKAYMDWILKYGSEYAKSRMLTFYEPTWEIMSKEVEALIEQHVGAIST